MSCNGKCIEFKGFWPIWLAVFVFVGVRVSAAQNFGNLAPVQGRPGVSRRATQSPTLFACTAESFHQIAVHFSFLSVTKKFLGDNLPQNCGDFHRMW